MSADATPNKLEVPVTELTKQDTEAQSDHKDTYLHGLKLVLVFFGLASSMFLIVLDQTILIPAIPVIASTFDSVGQIGWISSSYFVTQCAAILLWGQALAFFAQKTPLMISIAIFELGSLIAGVSQNFTTLIVGRSIAGLGGAAMLVAAMSISSVVIELKRRPIFFGLFGIIFVIGSTLGPIIGGSFTSSGATWRWCFYLNLPIGGLSMLAILYTIPSIAPPARPSRPPHFLLRVMRKAFGDRPSLAEHSIISRISGLDWVAGIILLGGIVSLTLALTDGGANGWSTKTVIVGFTMAGVALILLLLWEILVMKEHGMVPIRVARFRSVWGSSGVAFFRMMNSLVIVSYLPTYLQATRHQSALQSAVSTLPYTIGMALFALIGSVAVQKSGRYKWALVAGSAISSVGAGLLYTLGPDTAYAKIAGFQIIAALGTGLIMMNGILAAQAEMDANGLAADIPQASALVSLLQLLGGSLGGSIGGALLTNGLRRYASALPETTIQALLESVETVWTLSGDAQTIAIDAYARGMDDVFVSGAAAGALGVIFALICRDRNIKGKNFKH